MEYTNEDFFLLLKENKFNELLKIESKYRKNIIENEMIKSIFDIYFIESVVNYIDSNNDKLYSYMLLRDVYNRFIQHRNKTYDIKDEVFEKLVIRFITISNVNDKKEMAYKVSKSWSHLNCSKKVIEEYEKNNPVEIKHSNDDIKLSHNANIHTENKTIPLFKSKQEYDFYYSIIDKYPNHMTYPNVALSCLIDFEKIKYELSNEEKKYFFMSVVDCVVFKQDDNNFTPKYFFELDSVFHDKKEIKEKDMIKDKILSLAGQKLYRIRSKDDSKNLTKNDFKKLINESLSSS